MGISCLVRWFVRWLVWYLTPSIVALMEIASPITRHLSSPRSWIDRVAAPDIYIHRWCRHRAGLERLNMEQQAEGQPTTGKRGDLPTGVNIPALEPPTPRAMYVMHVPTWRYIQHIARYYWLTAVQPRWKT